MEEYNRLISAKVLDGYEAMLDKLPQNQMLGGKRMRKYVLPSSSESDYPATLSVGRMDGERPATLGGEFWRDFGDGFPTGSLQGGKKFNFGKALKSVGKVAAPIAKDVGKDLAKEGIKEGIKQMKNPKETAAAGRRHRRRSILHSIGKAAKSVGRELAPAAKEVFHDVVVPEGKKALKQYIKESLKAKPSEKANEDEMIVGKGRRGRPRKVMGADPRTFTPKNLGGALLRDAPSEFHSSVYPPSLASYAHSFPQGHDSYGRGRAKLPASGAKRNFARGAIVSEIMKKKGLSLGAASKYVKDHNLY